MNVVDQAVWALGNIAGNGAVCRDFTVQCGIIQPLIDLIKPTTGVRGEGGVSDECGIEVSVMRWDISWYHGS